MNIIGIDCALRKTGITVLNNNTKSFYYFNNFTYQEEFKHDYRSAIHNKLAIKKFLKEELIPELKPQQNMFVIEALPSGGHYKTSMIISATRNNWYHAIDELSIEGVLKEQPVVLSPSVAEWKSKVLKKHNLKKTLTTQVIRNLYYDTKKYNFQELMFFDIDILDASGLSIFGSLTLEKK